LPTNELSQRSLKFNSYDGCQLQITRWGQNGPACIFLHGSGEGRYIWDDFAPTLAPQFQSLIVDLRGHGDSDWDPAGRYNFEAYVKDMVRLIDELRLKNFAIVGHSLGGRIAAHVAAARAEGLFALVIVDSGPALQKEGTARIRSDFKESHQVYATIDDYADWLERRRGLVPKEKLRHFALRSLRPRPDGAFELRSDPTLLDHPDNDTDEALWRALAEVRCPALVLRGIASSVLTNEVAERVAGTLPQGRLCTITGAGHGLVVENPEAFASATRQFLRQSVISSIQQPDFQSV
jgi:pimeloyl-ACP methyl ester carboxylesterase